MDNRDGTQMSCSHWPIFKELGGGAPLHHGVGVGTILVPQLFHEMDILSSVKTIMSTV